VSVIGSLSFLRVNGVLLVNAVLLIGYGRVSVIIRRTGCPAIGRNARLVARNEPVLADGSTLSG